MKVLISGPATYLGRTLVSELARRGHKPYGMVSSETDANIVIEHGGIPVMGDPISGGKWCRTAKIVDSVISLTQPLDGMDPSSVSPSDYPSIGRKHAESVTNLMKAAADGAARSFILSSSYLCYGDRKGKWASNEDAFDPTGACRPMDGYFEGIIKTAYDAGLPLVHTLTGLEYGPGGCFAKFVQEIKDGKATIVEPGNNYLSMIHVEDAAAMLALTAEKVHTDTTFFIADDRPVEQDTFVNFIANAIGVPPPPVVSFETFAKQYGLAAAETISSSTRVPGLKAMELLNYYPKFRSYEAGLVDTLKRLGLMTKETYIKAA